MTGRDMKFYCSKGTGKDGVGVTLDEDDTGGPFSRTRSTPSRIFPVCSAWDPDPTSRL